MKRKLYARARRVNADLARTLRTLANVREQRGELDKAEDNYKEALKMCVACLCRGGARHDVLLLRSNHSGRVRPARRGGVCLGVLFFYVARGRAREGGARERAGGGGG